MFFAGFSRRAANRFDNGRRSSSSPAKAGRGYLRSVSHRLKPVARRTQLNGRSSYNGIDSLPYSLYSEPSVSRLFTLFAIFLCANHLAAQELSPLESKTLANLKQVTSGFVKAGEGYFSP